MPCPTRAQTILHLKQLATASWFFTGWCAAELQGAAQKRQPPPWAQQRLEEGTLLGCKARRETRRNRAAERQSTSNGVEKYRGRKFRGQPSVGASCPKRWCHLHPWRCSRPGWRKPWETLSDPRAALGSKLGWRLPRSPLPEFSCWNK